MSTYLPGCKNSVVMAMWDAGTEKETLMEKIGEF